MTTGICYYCQREIDLARLRDDDAWRELVRLFAMLPAVVQSPLWQYLELVPLIKSGQLQKGQQTYSITTANWASALMYLVETPPDSMPQPLKGNGYLFGLITNRAEALLTRGEADKDVRLRDVTTEQQRACGFDVEKWKDAFQQEPIT